MGRASVGGVACCSLGFRRGVLFPSSARGCVCTSTCLRKPGVVVASSLVSRRRVLSAAARSLSLVVWSVAMSAAVGVCRAGRVRRLLMRPVVGRRDFASNVVAALKSRCRLSRSSVQATVGIAARGGFVGRSIRRIGLTGMLSLRAMVAGVGAASGKCLPVIWIRVCV